MGRDNIILIGMPGAGKSTIGVVLAKALGYDFVDSDIEIQRRFGKRLEEIIEEHGPDGFNKIEEDVNGDINGKHLIIATGGSAIYGPKAMEHFREIGVVVYIDLSCQAIASRLGDLKERGISMKDGQTLQDLYDERKPLYEKYAHITINTENLLLREAMEEIKNQYEKYEG